MLTLGLVAWMHSFTGGWGLFAHGLIVIIYIASVWWEDVIRELTFEEQHKAVVRRGLRFGMILFIISEIMFFFAFFGAFFHSSLSPVFSITDSAFESCFYMTTRFHGFPVLVGTVALCLFEIFYTFYGKVVISVSYLRMLWLFLTTFLKTYQTAIKIHGLSLIFIAIHAYIYDFNHWVLFYDWIYDWVMSSDDPALNAQRIIDNPELIKKIHEVVAPLDGGEDVMPPIKEAIVVIGVIIAVGAFIARILLFR